MLVVVEEGETLINYLAHVDLNPVRAGIVDRPDKYRWNGLGRLQIISDTRAKTDE